MKECGEKTPNDAIRCSVKSCQHHCGTSEHCTLGSISVQPCQNCGDGCACDESFCGSYCPRG